MNSCTHATTSQWQFKQRSLPDPALYRQSGSPAKVAASSEDEMDKSDGEDQEAASKAGKRGLSMDQLRPQPMSPPTSPQPPRRRSFSAFFHRQPTKS